LREAVSASNEIVYEKQDLSLEKSVELDIVESDKKPCRFRIIGKDVFGRPFDTTWETVKNTTKDGCDAAKNAKVTELENQEATIEKTIVTWG